MRQDPKFFRPAEVDLLIGDATKARTKLGWEPEVDFPTLVKMMVAHDLQLEAAKQPPPPRLTRIVPARPRTNQSSAGHELERPNAPGSGFERHVGDRFHDRLLIGTTPLRSRSCRAIANTMMATNDDNTSADLDAPEQVVACSTTAPSRKVTTPTPQPTATSAWPLRAITAWAMAIDIM